MKTTIASAVSALCGGRLHACPRYPVDKIEDRRPVEFSIDPEDRNAEIRYHDDVSDYYDYGT